MSKPKFERRHYELIAAVLRKGWDVEHVRHNKHLIEMFGDAFAKDNPNFNYEKFEEACEP